MCLTQDIILGISIMELNKYNMHELKEDWIDNIKYMTLRARYNHIELQEELYFQIKTY